MVIRFLILIYCGLFLFQAQALVPVVKKLPRDPDYYQHYLRHFNQWFNRNIYDWETVIEKSNLQKTIEITNHWIFAQDHVKETRYIQWGIGYNLKSEELFYKLAYLSDEAQPIIIHHDSRWSYHCVERLNTVTCQNHALVIKRITDTLKIPQNFPLQSNGNFLFNDSLVYSFGLYDKEQVVSLHFKLSDVQVEWLPKELIRTIQQIGLETRLPVDKISIHENGDIVVYYP
jgi:hypothetical protein